MAGTWMSLIEGFAGVAMKENQLSFSPKISKHWTSYSFHLNFRGRLIFIEVDHNKAHVQLVEGEKIAVLLNGKPEQLSKENLKIVQN